MKRNARRSAGIAVAMAFALATAGCGGGEEAEGSAADGMANMEPVTLTLTDVSPQEGSLGAALTAFMERVEKDTDGKITFDPYWSSALMPGDQMLSGIGTGTADIGLLITAYSPEALPVANFLNQLGPMPDASFPLGAVQGAAAATEMFAENETLTNEFEEHNLKVLAATYAHRFGIWCKEPVGSAEEARGLRVRTGGPVWSAELEAMGMVPVPLPVGDMYEGLQRGVVDCVQQSPNTGISFSLWDVAKYYYQLDMAGFVGGVLSVNLDTWNSLPADAQEVLSDAALQYWADLVTNVNAAFEQFATEGVDEHGMVFGDPRPLDEVLAEYHEESLADVADRAPAGVDDPGAFVDEFKTSLEKWKGILTADLGMEEVSKSPEDIQRSFEDAGSFDVTPVYERLREELGN